MPKLSPLTRAQVHNAMRQIEASLSPAIEKLAQQLVTLLEESGSASVKTLHESLFPLADTASAAAQLSTLTKAMETAAKARHLIFKPCYSGSKKGGVANRRFYFSAPRATPVADTEGLDAMAPGSRIEGQLSVPLDAAPILLLTYNDHEYVAVRAAFWRTDTAPPQRGSGADLVDDLGVLNGWPILHGHSRQGNRESQRSADTLRRAHTPYAIISVGIAFGLNDKKQAIGDVLVSKFIVDYEAGRVSPNGISLRNARPPASRSLVHGLEQLNVRSVKETGWPMLRFGGVLSGEKLVDDKDYRDSLLELAQQGDLVGGEMEGAGLFTALDDTNIAWIVVKAICDFADGHKNTDNKERHQQHAAQNAAAVVYALLNSDCLTKPKAATGGNSTSGRGSELKKPRERLRHNAHALGCDAVNVAGQLTDMVSLENIHDGEDRPKGPQTVAFEHLLQWLGDGNAPPLYALLGEYGMGKTTHCQTLTRHLEEAREKGQPMRAPLYFDLRKVEQIAAAQAGVLGHVATLEETVSDCLRNGYLQSSGQAHTYQDVLDVVDEGAVVIFDGLDEVLSRITDAQGLKFTSNLLKVLPEARARQIAAGRTPADLRMPKVLLSCRTQFFRNLAEQNSHLTGEHRGGQTAKQYEASVLQPFTDAQIRSYLQAVLPGQNIVELMSMLASIHNLRELAGRPFTLKLVAQFVPRIQSWQSQGRTITGATLYREVAREWLLRDKEKQSFQPQDKERLAADLAAHLWRNGQRGMHAMALEQWLDAWLSQLPAHASVLKKPRELLHQDVRNATFLKRTDADKPEDSQFEFAHTSLQEFFLADYLFQALQREAGASGTAPSQRIHWVMPKPSVETLDFLGQMLAEVGVQSTALQALSRWRAPYMAQASELQLAYAVRAYQRGWPLPITVGSDLQGADLTEWQLGCRTEPGVRASTLGSAAPIFDLSASNFSHAKLRRARFWQVRLDRASFAYAALSQSEFLQCSQLATDWDDADTAGWVVRPTVPSTIPSDVKGWTLKVAQGHLNSVKTCSFSSDGLTLLTGSSDDSLKLWDVITGDCLLTLEGHAGSVNCCAFSPDGLTLLSGSSDDSLKLWDATTGDCLRTLKGHADAVNCCAFSPNGLTLLSNSTDNTLKLWDATTGACLRTLTEHSDSVSCCAFSSDGLTLLSNSTDNTLKLWDATTGDCLLTLEGHAGSVSCCAFSPNGLTLLSGAADSTLKLWDAATGECLRTLAGHTGSVNCCTFSSDSLTLLSGAADSTLKLWDATTGECLRTLAGHASSVNCCAFSSDGLTLLSGADDRSSKLWNAATGECLRTLAGHGGLMSSCAFSPDGLTLLTGTSNDSLMLWDQTTGDCLRTMTGHRNPVSTCAFSPDGLKLLSGSWDMTLKLWDKTTGDCLRTLIGHTSMVSFCAFSPDGLTLLSASWDKTLKLWNTTTGDCLSTLSGHELMVSCCSFSPDGLTLLSASWDKTLKLWDTTTGDCLFTFAGHGDPISACAFSPDGMTLLSGSWDMTLKLWDAGTGHCLRTLAGHEGLVNSCAFSPDGLTLLSNSADNTLKLWDRGTGDCRRTLDGHGGLFGVCTFSPDSLKLFASTSGNNWKLWNAATGECLRSFLSVLDGSAAWESVGGRLLHASGRAWRYLRWQGQDAQGKPCVIPLESMPGVTVTPWVEAG